jgi:hypothetical protein
MRSIKDCMYLQRVAIVTAHIQFPLDEKHHSVVKLRFVTLSADSLKQVT